MLMSTTANDVDHFDHFDKTARPCDVTSDKGHALQPQPQQHPPPPTPPNVALVVFATAANDGASMPPPKFTGKRGFVALADIVKGHVAMTSTIHRYKRRQTYVADSGDESAIDASESDSDDSDWSGSAHDEEYMSPAGDGDDDDQDSDNLSDSERSAISESVWGADEVQHIHKQAEEAAASHSTTTTVDDTTLANVTPTAHTALQMTVSDEYGDYSPKPPVRLGTVKKKCNLLKAQMKRLAAENSKMRVQLATCVGTLRHHNLDVESSISGMVAGVAIPHMITFGNGVVAEPVANDAFPFCIIFENDQNTTSWTVPRRSDAHKWPAAYGNYSRKTARMVPIAEKRTKQILVFRLYDRLTPSKVVTEHDLLPGDARAIINYRLDLVYADTDEVVTIDSLNEKDQENITMLTEPNIVNTMLTPMVNGQVCFHISHLNVLSGMTIPIHRMFRYKLTCTHPTLSANEHMTKHTRAFYALSKLKHVNLKA